MRANGAAVAESFVRQLAWRDFFLQLLAEDPALAWRNLRAPMGISEPQVPEDRALADWREGRTGLPLVDAGMRQLLREGWMHNRARLVVASFLTRRLGVPFRYPAELVEGMRMDLWHRPYASMAELRVYLWRAAGTVGLWLAEAYGVRDPWALERAALLGEAMQLTNIIRDIGEDLDRGRLYVPLDMMEAYGLDAEMLIVARRMGRPLGKPWCSMIEELIGIADRDHSRIAAGVDVHTDQPLPVVRLRKVGVEVHVIAPQFGESFPSEHILGQPLDLAHRIETIENTFANLSR